MNGQLRASSWDDSRWWAEERGIHECQAIPSDPTLVGRSAASSVGQRARDALTSPSLVQPIARVGSSLSCFLGQGLVVGSGLLENSVSLTRLGDCARSAGGDGQRWVGEYRGRG